MKQSLAASGLALCLLASYAQEASAQSQILMRMSGVQGTSTILHYENWIPVGSLRQVLTADDLKKSACRVEVVKDLDRASPVLWLLAVSERRIMDVVIDVLTTGSLQLPFYRIWLGGVTIEQISTEGANPFTERVTLAGERGRLTYWEQRPDGSMADPVLEEFWCH